MKNPNDTADTVIILGCIIVGLLVALFPTLLVLMATSDNGNAKIFAITLMISCFANICCYKGWMAYGRRQSMRNLLGVDGILGFILMGFSIWGLVSVLG